MIFIGFSASSASEICADRFSGAATFPKKYSKASPYKSFGSNATRVRFDDSTSDMSTTFSKNSRDISNFRFCESSRSPSPLSMMDTKRISFAESNVSISPIRSRYACTILLIYVEKSSKILMRMSLIWWSDSLESTANTWKHAKISLIVFKYALISDKFKRFS